MLRLIYRAPVIIYTLNFKLFKKLFCFIKGIKFRKIYIFIRIANKISITSFYFFIFFIINIYFMLMLRIVSCYYFFIYFVFITIEQPKLIRNIRV